MYDYQIQTAAACLFAFLLGSIPVGLIIARFLKVNDLTRRGSGNIGATNVSRVLGFWPAGFLTFVFDLLKGAVPLLILSSAWSRDFLAQHFPSSDASLWDFNPLIAWSAAFFAVLGHCFSPWLHFRGGKGVATAFGAMLVLSPVAALCGIAAFALTFLNTKTGSLASLAGLLSAAAAYLIFEPRGAHLWIGAALVLVVLIRHEENLDALLQDRENKFV